MNAPPFGVLLLDKPLGLSSNAALQRVRRLAGGIKAGHTGSLDPLASGMLPICLGEATKLAGEMLVLRKCYQFGIQLGERSETGDAEGAIVERCPVPALTPDAVEEVLARFLGAQQQTPPMYSALKRDGKPLYEYARAGQVVEREARPVTIHALEMLDCALPDVTFRVTCSKGTYVRTLAEDIGEALGCGAHLVALRRTGVGALTLEHSVTLDALSDAAEGERDQWLQPVDALLSTFPAVQLDEEGARRFLHGQRLRLADLTLTAEAATAERVRVYAMEGKLLGVAKLGEGVLAPERLVVTAAS